MGVRQSDPGNVEVEEEAKHESSVRKKSLWQHCSTPICTYCLVTHIQTRGGGIKSR